MAKLTPIRAIRLKCLDCTCSQKNEVRYCEIDTCPLWPYRMGDDLRLSVSLPLSQNLS